MKKIYSCMFVVLSIMTTYAQNTSNNQPGKNDADSLLVLPRFCIDLNLKAGVQSQNLSFVNYVSGYTNPLNPSISNPKYATGATLGFDVQGGYFFGKKRHWGVGLGFMYLNQTSSLTMNNYHIEYQSTDYEGNIFRQLVTADQPIKETITSTNLNIPIVLKYKHQLGEKLGFAMDAGILYNLSMQNHYSTNASFDYEAIYDYVQGPQGNYVSVYDNSPVPNQSGDVLFTKAKYESTDPGNVNGEFDSLRKQGYNVGLGVTPKSSKGSVSYTTGSVGFLLKPSLSYPINKKLYLDLGVYYIYQTFKNNAVSYEMTNKLGGYSSMLNSETTIAQSSYGINIGVRYFFWAKDRDKDGVPDRKDRCPTVFGLKKYRGCPDTDGDGIPDPDDSCPTAYGLEKFHGCPDRDGDGIPDPQDRCPDQAGPLKYQGCPDSDGDGIPDIDDRCPKVFGLKQFNGCPDTDGDGIPDPDDSCPTVPGPLSNHGCPIIIDTPKASPVVTSNKIDISTPILFDVNKTNIHESSLPVIEEAAAEMKEDKDATITIDAYTDITGSKAYNLTLSKRRAEAVKTYLKKLGVNGKKVNAVGHGVNDPIAPNDTPEGRDKNRRAVMKLKHKQ